MARKTSGSTPRKAASLSAFQSKEAIPKLRRRLEELKATDLASLTEQTGKDVLASQAAKINATLRDVYGAESIEYSEMEIDSFEPRHIFISSNSDFSIRGNLDSIRSKVSSCLARLQTAIDLLSENTGEEPGVGGVLKAYEGLRLHSEIDRAASQLYRDGHFSNAVEASVKALNGLVRLRSGLEYDGTTLMERAFSPTSPVLKFNALSDQSDKDEQKGFMMMFSGAVSGLRNPRAHGFINDEPERALEFIAFVSLLAKLLDEART